MYEAYLCGMHLNYKDLTGMCCGGELEPGVSHLLVQINLCYDELCERGKGIRKYAIDELKELYGLCNKVDSELPYDFISKVSGRGSKYLDFSEKCVSIRRNTRNLRNDVTLLELDSNYSLIWEIIKESDDLYKKLSDVEFEIRNMGNNGGMVKERGSGFSHRVFLPDADDEFYQNLMDIRRVTIGCVAEMIGIRPEEVTFKMFKYFTFLHELGHIFMFYDKPIEQYRKERAKELVGLPYFPGKSPHVARKSIEGEITDMLRNQLDEHEFAYRVILSERRPDEFASDFILSNWDFMQKLF